MAWSVRSALRLGIETTVLALAVMGAFLLRFDGVLPAERLQLMLVVVPVIVAVEVAALHAVGIGRHSWQYTTIRDVFDITLVLAVVAIVLTALQLVGLASESGGAGFFAIPIGVIGANLVLAVLGLGGVRAVRRLQAEAHEKRGIALPTSPPRPVRHVVLIGAGRAGVLMAKELRRRPDLGMVAVGFLDDDRGKVGRRVAGLHVLGTVDSLARLCASRRVDGAVITIAALGRSEIRRIVAACEAVGLDTKIVPGVYEIVRGDVSVSRLRDVDIEDLLGREQVELDKGPARELVADRDVLVTGAGGSIGSELVRQAADLRPARMLLVERAEPALWAIHREIQRSHPDLDVVPLVADVCDRQRMAGVFAEFAPDVVLHAAAHKHVPMMEANPGEAVKNNVGGTRVVADLAAAHGVARFVLVSTDKAVNPTSVMGATKRIAERYVQHLARTEGLRGVAVRFGNVLGSTGSVVPIFKEQVAMGGPVTVTHPDMRRYFMTIPEASQLVLEAAAIGRAGEVMVLDMGEPVRILELAETVIRLSGFEPGVDIPVEFTGLRPGEKLFEELTLSHEVASPTAHPKIWTGAASARPWPAADDDLAALLDEANHLGAEQVRRSVRRLVPEFVPTAGSGPVLLEPGPAAGEVERSPGRGQGTDAVAPLPSAPGRRGTPWHDLVQT